MITTGMSQTEKAGEPSKLPGHESIADKLNKAVDKAQKAADKQADDGRLPNQSYDITPNYFPASTPPNVRQTIIRTDANGNVKDTIKWPSDEMSKKGNTKYDTIPNKKGN